MVAVSPQGTPIESVLLARVGWSQVGALGSTGVSLLLEKREAGETATPAMAHKSQVGFAAAGDVVVKLGSAVTERGMEPLAPLLRVIAKRVRAGDGLVLVASGAVAAGGDADCRRVRAAVGQGRLYRQLSEQCAREGLQTAQVLIRESDLAEGSASLCALLTSLKQEAILPVVNTNDALEVPGARTSNNDWVAASLASLVAAQAVLYCGEANGIYEANPKTSPGARRFSRVAVDDPVVVRGCATGASASGTGGMAAKLEHARTLVRSGRSVLVADVGGCVSALSDGDRSGGTLIIRGDFGSVFEAVPGSTNSSR